MNVAFIIYADLESLLEKMNTCHNNPKKSSTTKINKRTPYSYSLLTHCSFDTTKNKHDKKLLTGFKRACSKNNQL